LINGKNDGGEDVHGALRIRSQSVNGKAWRCRLEVHLNQVREEQRLVTRERLWRKKIGKVNLPLIGGKKWAKKREEKRPNKNEKGE